MSLTGSSAPQARSELFSALSGKSIRSDGVCIVSATAVVGPGIPVRTRRRRPPQSGPMVLTPPATVMSVHGLSVNAGHGAPSSRWTMVWAYFLLFVARVMVASLGPVCLWVSGDGDDAPPNIVVVTWRQIVMGFIALPPAILAWREQRQADVAYEAEAAPPSFDSGTGIRAVIAGVSLSINNLLWALSLDRTSVMYAYLLGWMHPPLLVAVLLCMGRKLSCGEIAGSFTTIAGAALLAVGAAMREAQQSEWVGNALALSSCGFNVVMILCAEDAAKRGLMAQYGLVLSVVSAAMLIGYICVDGDGGHLPPDSAKHWGFALYVGFGPGALGVLLEWWLLRHISPSILAMTAPTEPFLAGAIGEILGVSDMPSAHWDIIGSIIIVLSIVFAAMSRSRMEKKSRAEADDDLELPGGGPLAAHEATPILEVDRPAKTVAPPVEG